MGFSDNLDIAIRSAPQSQRDASIPVSSAMLGGDVQQNAEVQGHLLSQQSRSEALDEHVTKAGGHGLFGATVSWLGSGIKGALDTVGTSVEKIGAVANKGLSEVQHEYRYLRDLEARHGLGAALIEGTVMGAAGIGGAVLSGGNISAGILAAEAAGSITGRFNPMFKDSWDRTNSATYVDPNGGGPISPGRDFARALGSLSKHVGVHIEQHAGFDLYDVISAGGDGIFDLATDPLARGMSMKAAATSAEGLGGLLSRWGGTAAKADNIERAYSTYGSVRRGMDHLAVLSEGEIVSKYKKFAPMARELGKAKTAREVGQVFVDYANAAEMAANGLPNVPQNALFMPSTVTETLPRLTRKGELLGNVRAGLKDYEGIGGGALRRARTFVPSSLDPATGKVSRDIMNFGAADSARTIYDLALQGVGTEGVSTERRAQLLAEQWINSNVAERTHVYRNLLTENLSGRMEQLKPGWAQSADGQETLLHYADKIDAMMGGTDGGRINAWGYDKEGRIISTVTDKGQKVSIPILENQQFYAKLPDYLDFDRSLKALSNSGEMYGKVDDFLYDHFTQNVFKKWVLATGGFALRVASGELVPQLLGHPAETLKGKIATSLAKNSWKVEQGEAENVMAPIVKAMANGLKMSDDEIAYHANRIKLRGGDAMPLAVDAGHPHGERVIGEKEWSKREFSRLQQETPTKQRITEENAGFGPDAERHWVEWHADANNVARSPGSVAAAAEYRIALDEGASEFEASHRAALKGKEVLDSLPQEQLDQLPRHFQSTVDERVPGVVDTTVRRWVPGTPAQRAVETEFVRPGTPGHWEVLPGGHETEFGIAEPSFVKGEPASTYTKDVMVPEAEQQGVLPGIGVEPQRMTGENVVVTPGEMKEVEFARQGLPGTAPDPHEDWSRVMVENLKGKFIGQDGTIHREVLDAIAEGRAPSMEYMKGVPVESRPAKVLGAYEMPAPPDKKIDKIFSVLNGTIRWIAREPIFARASWSEYQTLKPLVDQGLMTLDAATAMADTRAIQRVLPHVHNINERTLLSEHSRNFVPFMFAQQQSYARLFRLLAEDPVAFRRAQLAYFNMANFGGIYSDEGGNHQVVMPGLGYLTQKGISALGMANIPVVNSLPTAFSGNLKSLASLSPFMEGGEVVRPGPLVAMPLRAINNLLPETKAITTPITGETSEGQPFWSMIVPNATVRNLMSTIIPMDNRTQAKSVLDAVQALEYKQNVEMRKYVAKHPEPALDTPEHADWLAKGPQYVPGPTATDMQIQEYVDRIKNHARILTMTKGIIGAISPVAPSVQIGNVGLKQEVYDLIKEKGIDEGIAAILEKDPDATPYTIFQSAKGLTSPIDPSHPAQEWVKGNMDFVKSKKYSTAAAYFVPRSNDKFDQEVYNEQQAMGLRLTKSPEQLFRSIHEAEGNRWYFDTYKPALDEALSHAPTPHDRRVVQTQFKTLGSPDGKVQSLDSMKLANPMWYSNFSSGARDVTRQLAITQMRDAVASGEAPESPMTPLLTGLLQHLTTHQERMLPGRTDSYAALARKQEQKNWEAHLKTVKVQHPELEMAINGVFRGA